MLAYFSDTPKTLESVIKEMTESHRIDYSKAMRVHSTYNGSFADGSTHSIMTLIGELAARGHDSLTNIVQR